MDLKLPLIASSATATQPESHLFTSAEKRQAAGLNPADADEEKEEDEEDAEDAMELFADEVASSHPTSQEEGKTSEVLGSSPTSHREGKSHEVLGSHPISHGEGKTTPAKVGFCGTNLFAYFRMRYVYPT